MRLMSAVIGMGLGILAIILMWASNEIAERYGRGEIIYTLLIYLGMWAVVGLALKL